LTRTKIFSFFLSGERSENSRLERRFCVRYFGQFTRIMDFKKRMEWIWCSHT